MENKKERLSNINFEYADKVLVNKDREHFLSNQANLWLEPLIEEINKEPEASVNFYLKEGDENRVHFTGMNDELESKAYERLKLFQVRQ